MIGIPHSASIPWPQLESQWPANPRSKNLRRNALWTFSATDRLIINPQPHGRRDHRRYLDCGMRERERDGLPFPSLFPFPAFHRVKTHEQFLSFFLFGQSSDNRKLDEPAGEPEEKARQSGRTAPKKGPPKWEDGARRGALSVFRSLNRERRGGGVVRGGKWGAAIFAFESRNSKQ